MNTQEALDPGVYTDGMVPRLFEIKDLIWETGDGSVFTWQLEAKDTTPFAFKPGQFNMLYSYGVGEVAISISGSNESDAVVHTIRAVGSVTNAMQQLKPGYTVGLRGPFGNHWPVEQAYGKDLVIIAGGVGLAPLRPVVYYAMQHLDKFNRVNLLYGTRTPLDILYRDELEVWQHEKRIHVAVTVDRAPPTWRGDIGVVTNLIAKAKFDPQNTIAMICGPEVMMTFSEMALQKAGLEKNQMYASIERNMKCAIGHCGHCQWGPYFICKDGPVFRIDRVEPYLQVREL
jgi:NAD(P)H-flavin reductase